MKKNLRTEKADIIFYGSGGGGGGGLLNRVFEVALTSMIIVPDFLCPSDYSQDY